MRTVNAEIVRTLLGCTNPFITIFTLRLEMLYEVLLRLLNLMVAFPVVLVIVSEGEAANREEMDDKAMLTVAESES